MAYAWPDDSIAILKRMHAEGWSCSRIANAINAADPDARVSRNAVIGKLNRMGIVTPRPSRAPLNPPHKHKRAPNWFMPSNHAPAPRINPKPMPSIPDEPGPTAIPFSKRRPLQCAWIFDKAANADSLCCGRPIQEGARYDFCPQHMARATQRIKLYAPLSGSALKFGRSR